MNEGHFAEACPKLAASEKLDPGAGTLLNLGTCYEKNNQTASAWATFREAASAAHASGHLDWENSARAKADKLEPELAKLVVSVPTEARVKGLVVERDGTALDAAEWAAPIPTDGGAHTIRASAPGKKAWSTQITIGAARSQATVSVPVLEDDADAKAAVVAPPPAPPAPKPPSDGSTQRIVGLVLGGTGIVAIGLGTIFGLKAKSTYNDAKTHCNAQDLCQQRGLDLDSHATTQATVSTIAFIGGGALIAGGVVLYLTAPSGANGTSGSASAPPPLRDLRISLGAPSVVGLAPLGLTAGGAF